MGTDPANAARHANDTRYRSGQARGHYESFFQRANHPSRPLAFWIRYTIFSPERRPEAALGELWAVYFDGESGRHVAVKREVPFSQCQFSSSGLAVEIADATLRPGALTGSATSGVHRIAWDLTFRGDAQPLFLLPLGLYEASMPRAKSLVGLPMASYSGSLSVDGQDLRIADWVGSQNHNWGRRHTDEYAWGQVAGFDSHPESFLEIATARVKFGPLWTPFMTPLVLRHRGKEIVLNSWRHMLRAQASFTYFVWNFRAETNELRLEGTISARREAFVGLRYYNPPGGEKHCLNTKLAACRLTLTDRRPGQTAAPEVIETAHRAAFEILTDARDHGIEIRA